MSKAKWLVGFGKKTKTVFDHTTFTVARFAKIVAAGLVASTKTATDNVDAVFGGGEVRCDGLMLMMMTTLDLSTNTYNDPATGVGHV